MPININLNHNRQDVIAKIKQILKTKMTNKLDENAPCTYISVPEGKTKSEIVSAIAYFIDNKLDEFISLCLDVLPHFTQKDNESIGTDQQTENAKKFIALMNYLNQKGFPCIKEFKKPVNFWSGKEAQKKASGTVGEISDSNVPTIAALFDTISVMQDVQHQYNFCLLTSALSRIYATYAAGIANVYISTVKFSETPGLSVANNFWLAELPTLMALKNRGLLNDIQIHFYDHRHQVWKKSISIFSTAADSIPIRRRYMHALDAKNLADRFIKEESMSEKEMNKFYDGLPRPFITYGSLKRIAQEWRERSRRHQQTIERNNNNANETKATADNEASIVACQNKLGTCR